MYLNSIRLILISVFLFFAQHIHAQDINANSPKPNAGSRQQLQADKKKAKQKKEIEKGNEEGRKRHEKIQSKKTKKMMKKSKRKSKKWNDA